MQKYLEILQALMEFGEDTKYRNGTCRSMFGMVNFSWNLANGFPALTTKELLFKSVVAELLFFLSGSSDNAKAVELGTNIWTANANADHWRSRARFAGDLGRIYGVQWRHWRGPDGQEVDQISRLLTNILAVKENPEHESARRLLITAWNPAELDDMCLAPCHVLYQFNVGKGGKLSVCMSQRSADVFLGLPFNIASTALLLSMLAHVTGLTPGTVTINIGDAHIYNEHFDAVKRQLNNAPLAPPTLWLNPEITDLFLFTPEDIALIDYNHHGRIAARMSV